MKIEDAVELWQKHWGWVLAVGAVTLVGGTWYVSEELRVKPKDERIVALKEDKERLEGAIPSEISNEDVGVSVPTTSLKVPMSAPSVTSTVRHSRRVNAKFVDKYDVSGKVIMPERVSDLDSSAFTVQITNPTDKHVAITGVKFEVFDVSWIHYTRTENNDLLPIEAWKDFIDVPVANLDAGDVFPVFGFEDVIKPHGFVDLSFRICPQEFTESDTRLLRLGGYFTIETDAGLMDSSYVIVLSHPDGMGVTFSEPEKK